MMLKAKVCLPDTRAGRVMSDYLLSLASAVKGTVTMGDSSDVTIFATAAQLEEIKPLLPRCCVLVVEANHMRGAA